MTKRPYRMTRRARSQEETRRKIVEATMELHEEVGPRATTISAIAEKAGVQRLTVYRHFSDEAAVFRACTSHWLELNPPPGPEAWAAIEDPALRLETALEAFYRYYSATRGMWTAAHRDAPDVPALHGPMAEFSVRVASLGRDLAASFSARGRAARRLEATIGHALAFPTWAELDERGLSDREKAELAGRWVAGVRPAARR